MDFGELLHTAKKNEQTKRQIQYYSTKFSAPKKEQRAKTVSVNVQKFLARKEAEEKHKAQEEMEKRNNLLALRSQDKKATRRVNVMLKRTKSANQAVIEDALDSDNTAVTLAGPSQPDEDDYGYVSQESSALYNKMMEKYSKMPDEPKFPQPRKKISTNLNSTKDRVRAALEKEKEEALLPHRRKRKHIDTDGETEKIGDRNIEYDPEPEKKELSKAKFKPAPRVNFSDLLKLAEKKQFEPVVIEQKKDEEERPLTKRQKKEMEREKEWRERKESRNKTPQEKPQAMSRIPKINESSSPNANKSSKKVSLDVPDSKKLQKMQETLNYQNNKALDKNSNFAKINKIPSKTSTSNDRKYSPHAPEMNKKCDIQQRPLNGVKSSTSKPIEKTRVESRGSNQTPPSSFQKHRAPAPSDKPRSISSQDSQKKVPIPNNKINQKQSTQQNGLRTKEFPQNSLKSKPLPSHEHKPKQLPSNDLKPKQFPPKDHKPKQFPPSDLRPKQFPPPDVRRNPKDVNRKPMANKRRIIDDEEYDSEMDDFIDDGPEADQDYSKYISEIFGYDKRKYQYDDDDDDNMESTFAQQMKEEILSTKIGIMEDLEDIRQEEEAKKRKLLMQKKCKKL
ncbi:hypothetical protein AMK59_3210 [Oryctes borbonicus]|uniref:Protein SPT2 homolog n=1 Tax=Oryctes borbonicus TaxID=1629725 RepID=A0A0T6B5B2_9SCAR|nr:hypothetical protein AMK59_3210 [Oryctes borbonicus]